ncbi:MAG: sugar phosphate isomerase/epimerase [Candidatus Hydrogenedentes bacterium]|nr:sugar phosphate isomerase/epimerase [Candidatus Hydrogenedentota bacterium]MBI3119928.1 sugar phosphate isomerase/epimerase [Candidatus Hydrogenedentota bacterium]
MKLGVTYWMLGGFEGRVPVEAAAEAAARMGYQSIELSFGPGVLGPATAKSELEQMRAALDQVGVELSSLATPVYWEQSLSSPDKTERRAAIAFTQAYVRAASALGTDAVLVVPGAVDVPWAPSRPVVPAAEAYRLAQDSIRAVLPLAEELGVTLCIENVWNKFLTGPFEMAAFIDSFGSARVRAYFDAGNCVINGYPEHWVEVLGERIGRVHIKNFTRRNGGGTLDDFTGSLLEGSVNWAGVLQALQAIGYDGFVTAEVLVSERGLPDAEMSARVAREMAQLFAAHGSGT